MAGRERGGFLHEFHNFCRTCSRRVAAARRPSQRRVSNHVKGEGAAANAAARSVRRRLGVCAFVSASASATKSWGLRG